jgi:hypothetical protein
MMSHCPAGNTRDGPPKATAYEGILLNSETGRSDLVFKINNIYH